MAGHASETTTIMGTTVTISYDLKDNGRHFTGRDRDWDIPSCIRVINSPKVQEARRKGDLLGYAGHIPRTLAGTLKPVEGALIGGKYVAFEYATCVRSIACTDDGVVTHTTEFLDTDAGRASLANHQAGVGGFSSAMAKVPRTSPGIAAGFFGLDYVAMPNYDGNRGYRGVLDSADGADGDERPEGLEMVLDMVAADARAGEMAAEILADVMPQYRRALEALEAMERDRVVLIDRLAKVGAGGEAVLDSANGGGAARPRTWVRSLSLDDMRSFGSVRTAATGGRAPEPEALARARAVLSIHSGGA